MVTIERSNEIDKPFYTIQTIIRNKVQETKTNKSWNKKNKKTRKRDKDGDTNKFKPKVAISSGPHR